MEEAIWRQVLRVPVGARTSMLLRPTQLLRLPSARNYSSAPTIAQPSFWRSLIPKPLRRKQQDPMVNFGPPRSLKKPKKDWNPATFYIVIFLFIGSMSIQMIALKKDFNTFMRRSETRIGVLREVVEKLQRGEEFDVEKALGTGDAEKEMEWEDVLKEIERDDSIRAAKRNDRPRHSSKSAAAAVPKVETETQQTPGAEQSKAKAVNYSGFF
ncbi:hypothetical protein BJ170DRAFT_327994 [Xylariales sp. AK1849]|nr:hypothetical protein BJ170DRAFT_327994 [Xylariales sp. AK1849]